MAGRFRLLTMAAFAMGACGGLWAPAYAHDAWMRARLVPGASSADFDVGFFIGHGGEASRWPASSAHISSFFSIGVEGRVSHLNVLAEQSVRRDKRIRSPQGGVRLIGLDTFRRFNQLEADKFNAYVEEEGVTPIKLHRLATDTKDADGKELYSRHFKSIVAADASVGAGGENSDGAFLTKPIGQLLEITPDANPLDADFCEPFPLTVYYKGRRLPGATVHFNSLSEPDVAYTVKTDAAGRAVLEERPSGDWYAHVAWAEPVQMNAGQSNKRNADFATAFASLTVNGYVADCVCQTTPAEPSGGEGAEPVMNQKEMRR